MIVASGKMIFRVYPLSEIFSSLLENCNFFIFWLFPFNPRHCFYFQSSGSVSKLFCFVISVPTRLSVYLAYMIFEIMLIIQPALNTHLMTMIIILKLRKCKSTRTTTRTAKP